MPSIRERYPALTEPLYRRYWFASLASVGGTQLLMLGQGWVIYDLSGSTWDLGVLGAATSIPAILMTFWGGALADRYEKKRLLIYTSTMTAILCALLFILVLFGFAQVWHVWTIAALIAVISGIDWPTRQSFFPHLIKRSMMLSAVALNSILWQVTRMIMPAIGGLILALDMSLVFLLGAIGYALMTWALVGMPIHVPGSVADSTINQIKEGLRFIASESLFVYLLTLSFGGMLFASSYTTLMPAFAKLLGSQETGYGLLLSISGLGSIVGTAVVGSLTLNRSYGSVILWAALASGITLIGFSISTIASSFWIATVFVALNAAFTSISMVLLMTALQAAVPDQLRGRVMGIHSITYSLMPFGGLLLGALAVPLGAPYAVIISCLLFFVVIGYVTFNGPIRSIHGSLVNNITSRENKAEPVQ